MQTEQPPRTTLTLPKKAPPQPVLAALCRSYDQLVQHGPGGYCLTRGALWAFLPGLSRPLRMNVSDEAVRPFYTVERDEHGRVVTILDLIESQGSAWRWRDGSIVRTR